MIQNGTKSSINECDKWNSRVSSKRHVIYIPGVPKNVYTFYIITLAICSTTFAQEMALIK
jgi:hypothetical protein